MNFRLFVWLPHRIHRSAMAFSLSLAACSESFTGTQYHSSGQELARQEAPDQSDRAAIEARQSLRRQPAHWVGATHNDIVEAFRAELSKPLALSAHFCDHVNRFVSDDARLPATKRIGRDDYARVVATVQREQRGCGRKEGAPGQPSLMAAEITQAAISTNASLLMERIESSISVAYDAYDLAWRLRSILDEAQGLDALESAVISATVSVAQNSFEYWHAYYPSFEQQVAVACESVPSDYKSGSPCYSTMPWIKAHTGGSLVGLDERSTAMDVGDDIAAGFRAIGSADARGAFAGAYAGAYAAAGATGPNPITITEGALLGAVVGGSGQSIWVAGTLAAAAWCKIMCSRK